MERKYVSGGIERLLPHVRQFASIQYLLADAAELGR